MKRRTGIILSSIILLIVLITNIIMLARVLGMIYLPGEVTPLDKARQAAQSVIKYSEDLAASYELANNKEVRDILARFKYEIEKAENVDAVASLMLDYGRQTQDVIFRLLQEKQINQVFSVINSQSLPQSGKITIARFDNEMQILDPDNILTEESIKKLEEISFNQTLEIEIIEGRARLVPTGDIINQVNFLQTKVASLERQLKALEQKAGYEAMTGKGIIIKVYDNMGNNENTGIVHDQDIRNIVNELKIAGAAGIEIGGQRLNVTSAIRCVGPTILVNNKPIPVNPITIKAIGEPEVLASSLDIIKNQLRNFGIRMDISVEEELRLSGQSNYER